MWDSPYGRVLTPSEVASYYPPVESSVGPNVLQMTRFDPGCAAYRYHSAANSVAGGRSIFARFRHENPFCDLRQFDMESQQLELQLAADRADVLHVHMDYETLDMLYRGRARTDQLLVRHYHGSDPIELSIPQPPIVNTALDDELGAVQIGARLYHKRKSARMHWLPIPVPVRDYRALVERFWTPIDDRPHKRVRIAHSPTRSRIKGSMELEVAVQDLRLRHVPVELVMIQGRSHEEALILKASCDITFDSFWLGIQGSGLEAAAMGQAVIAGDAEVKDEYIREIGHCPYTFASGFDDLRVVIENLVCDDAYRLRESCKATLYAETFHDYPVVGRRYWEILDAEQKTRHQKAA